MTRHASAQPVLRIVELPAELLTPRCGRPKWKPQTAYGWRARLNHHIRAHVHTRVNGQGVTSYNTRLNITNGLFRLFSVLRQDLGFRIENPARLKTSHLRALARWLESKWRSGELESSTIQGYRSYLNILCGWNGTPQIMDAFRFEDPMCGVRSANAAADKSWEAHGIDIADVIERAWDIEPWISMALLAQASFGLRRKEAICLVPALDYDPVEGVLRIERGTKGGRPRTVVLYTEWQFQVVALLIEYARLWSNRKHHLGGADRDLKQNLRRYAYVVGSRLGITRDIVGTTGHGLRAGFACRMLSAFGVLAPVRGGDVRALPDDVVQEAYTTTAEATGHSRLRIVGAYAGAISARGNGQHPEGVDMQRIDPPDIDELIQALQQRRQDERGRWRLLREAAIAHGARVPSRSAE